METNLLEISKPNNQIEDIDTTLANISKKRNKAANPVTAPVNNETEVVNNVVATPESPANEKVDTELVLNRPKAKPADPVKPEIDPASPEAAKPKSKNKFWEKDEAPAAAAPAKEAVELPQDVKDELQLLREIVGRTSVKAVLKAEESGKPLHEYMDEVRGNDPSKMDNLSLYRQRLTEAGKDADTIERMAELFDLKDEIDQAMIIDDYREKKTQEYKNALEKISPDVMASAKSNAEKRNKTHSEYLNMVTDLDGKIYDDAGLVITPERAKELKNFYNSNNLLGVREDGSIDPKDLLDFTIYKLYKKAIFNSIHENAYKEGFEALEGRITQPMGAMETTSVSTPTPVRGAPKSEDQKRYEGLKSSLPS